MKKRPKLHIMLLSLLAFCVSALLGMGLAKAIESPYGMVDPVATNHAASYATYIENCSSCHLALPAAVLPMDTWQILVTDPAHYGIALTNITRFDQRLMLSYLQTYSRRHDGRGLTPYRLKDSNYFQALHPNVALPEPLNLRSCVGCHAGAPTQDYRPTVTQN